MEFIFPDHLFWLHLARIKNAKNIKKYYVMLYYFLNYRVIKIKRV